MNRIVLIVIMIRNVLLVELDMLLKKTNVNHVLMLIVNIVNVMMTIIKIVNALNAMKDTNMCIKQMNVYHVNIHTVSYV